MLRCGQVRDCSDANRSVSNYNFYVGLATANCSKVIHCEPVCCTGRDREVPPNSYGFIRSKCGSAPCGRLKSSRLQSGYPRGCPDESRDASNYNLWRTASWRILLCSSLWLSKGLVMRNHYRQQFKFFYTQCSFNFVSSRRVALCSVWLSKLRYGVRGESNLSSTKIYNGFIRSNWSS
jgi:hypothetical protein